MTRSSCLCGGITWQHEGPVTWMAHCHCSRCRKTHGTAFATHAAFPAEGFRMDDGGQRRVRWQSSAGSFRCFCGACGSVVPSDPSSKLAVTPAGNFDEVPRALPALHMFVGSKASWYEIPDELPRFAAFPPAIEAEPLPDREPLDAAGATRGSCLCGNVAYVLTGTVTRCVYCHCGRCRKARSAPFASSLGTALDGVRFTRGEAELSSYKLPDAKHFTHTFCKSCGSSMPRLDQARGIAIVPMGSLDDDPGVRPSAHIFAGSQAPWDTISDELPRYDGYPTDG
jgi:hypothetical protein